MIFAIRLVIFSTNSIKSIFRLKNDSSLWKWLIALEDYSSRRQQKIKKMLTICRRPISYSVCLRDSVKRFPNETTKVRVKEKREKLHLPRDPGPRMVSLIFRHSEEKNVFYRAFLWNSNFLWNEGSKDRQNTRSRMGHFHVLEYRSMMDSYSLVSLVVVYDS